MAKVNKRIVGLLTVVLLISIPSYSQSNQTESHTHWVAKALKEIKSIKVGMNREELLKVLTGEGGISSRKARTYVYRECPYIKVDVKFEPIEALEDRFTEYPSDRIIEVSKPYLEWRIID